MAIDLDKVVLAAKYLDKKGILLRHDLFLDALSLSREEETAVIELQSKNHFQKQQGNKGVENIEDSPTISIFVVRDALDIPVAVFNTYKEAYLYNLSHNDFSITRSVIE